MFVQNEQILTINPVQPHNTDTFYRITDYFWAQIKLVYDGAA